MGVSGRGRLGLSTVQKKELWDRWKAGESLSNIARMLEKHPDSIHGIASPQRHRPRWALSLAEREEISRGLAAGYSMHTVAARLSRSASTASREVNCHGGRVKYRAQKAAQ